MCVFNIMLEKDKEEEEKGGEERVGGRERRKVRKRKEKMRRRKEKEKLQPVAKVLLQPMAISPKV